MAEKGAELLIQDILGLQDVAAKTAPPGVGLKSVGFVEAAGITAVGAVDGLAFAEFAGAGAGLNQNHDGCVSSTNDLVAGIEEALDNVPNCIGVAKVFAL